MQSTRSFLYLIAIAVISQLALLHVAHASSNWDRLTITWAKFSSIPITEQDAISKGWVVYNATSVNFPNACDGIRYINNGDVGALPIFGKDSTLVGYSIGMPNAPSANTQLYWDKFNDGNFIISMYYVTPDLICAPQPHPVAPASQIGSVLALKTTSPSLPAPTFKLLPLNATNAESSGWLRGKCFVSMGVHYWFNMNQNLDCGDIFPIFLLVNGGNVDAWGVFQPIGPAQTSPHWEHPTWSVVGAFMDLAWAPTCLQNVTLSTEHVYMTNALFDLC